MQLNETDSKKVEAIKSQLRVLGPKITALQPYTRPLGKSQVPFAVAQIMENRHAEYSAEFTKLSNQLRRIYKANGMEQL